MTSDHGDELGTDRSQRHWRLVSVQAGGGLTVVRQRTRRSMQQLQLAGFLAKHSSTVAGIGDTRLGDDITSFITPVKHAALAEHERAAEAIGDSGTGSPGRPITSSWHSPGSSADRNGVWRGGVALGSYGEAQQRLYTATLLTAMDGGDIEERYIKEERGGSSWWYRRTVQTRST